jgi:hypothetical protein
LGGITYGVEADTCCLYPLSFKKYYGARWIV